MSQARLSRGVLLNGLGWVIPAALALAAIPALTRALGPERFGLLALAWAAVSVFAILDLGLGRALSIIVARSEASEVPALTRAAGVIGWAVFAPLAAIGVALAPWIAERALDLPAALREEGVLALRLLALSLPLVVHGILLRAVFEGQQRFGMVNALRIPLGVATWGGPWLAVLFTEQVSVLVAVIVGGRALYWLAQLLVLRAEFAAVAAATPSPYRTLLLQGGWITLSGVISPILTSADRLVVPLIAPIAAVGWYVAAGEAATKLWLVTAALTPVLAPALAAAYAQAQADARAREDADVRSDAQADAHARAAALLRWAAQMVTALLLAPTLVGVVYAEPLLQWWLAEAFAPEAVTAFRVFLVAVYLNSIAQVAYAGLQAGGRARAAAMLHVIELPLFLLALLWLGREYGALGAGYAWAGRLGVDALCMLWLARKQFSGRA